MKGFYLLCAPLLGLLLGLLPLAAQAQLADSFADGDFTQNPAWTGDAGSFVVSNEVLQSNGPAVTGTRIQLVTGCQAAVGTTWEFYANLKLATSSANLADVWLVASQPDLISTATKGYFVRLGGTSDEISLFRKDSARTAVLVIDGLNSTLGSTNNVARVRVTRSAAGQWTLAYDLSGGTTYTTEPNAPTDLTYTQSVAVGVSLIYSSANGKSFLFDDFRVTDTTAPALLQALTSDSRTVDLVFNEALDAPTANDPAHYQLAGGVGPATAQVSASNPTVVHLTFANDFGASNTIEVRNVADLYGNVATGPLTAAFTGPALAPKPGELIITELLADETPQVGLPASEFIEIYNNTTGKTLSLRGVRVLKPGSSTAAVLPDSALLPPGGYAIVCGSTRVAQFAGYGRVYGPTNFPSLLNTGDDLVLRGRDGVTLFEVAYTDDWYRDELKKNGGWTLEMIDPANYCGGAENWRASQDPTGGTPDRRNSVAAANPDRAAPTLLRAVPVGASTVRLFFGEKLDSATAANPALYQLQSSTGTPPAIAQVLPIGPDFRTVDLLLSAALPASQPLVVVVAHATDCAGNASGLLQSAAFALAEAPQAGDVVLNEVLFYHRPNGVYFVELLNRSARFLNLQGYQVVVMRSDGSTAGAALLSPDGPYQLAPGQVAAITTDAGILAAQYPSSSDPTNFLVTSSLPALDNDSGTLIVLDNTGQELDRYAYNKTQHLSLLTTQAGVSLERIRANGPSTASNFHSAASTVGYATPGRANSQALDAVGGQEWAVAPEIFTPDDDGQQDFTTLNYTLDQPGYVASVTVYDALGRLTRRLTRNESLPTTGFVQWDGLDDRGQKAAIGYYILYVELFRPSGGERQELKRTVVVGARL